MSPLDDRKKTGCLYNELVEGKVSDGNIIVPKTAHQLIYKCYRVSLNAEIRKGSQLNEIT